CVDCKTGIENLVTTAFKIDSEGWPSRSCQSLKEGVGLEAAKKDGSVDGEAGHLYNSYLVLLLSNGTPEDRSYLIVSREEFNVDFVSITQPIDGYEVFMNVWDTKNIM